jgi:hypothetical protein
LVAEQIRESWWTESVAVGSRKFVETLKAKLRIRAKGRGIAGKQFGKNVGWVERFAKPIATGLS